MRVSLPSERSLSLPRGAVVQYNVIAVGKAAFILAIALLLAVAAQAQAGEAQPRRAPEGGDDLQGRYYYLSAFIIIPALVLFALGFVLSWTPVLRKITGKHMLALTWFLVALGVGWIHMMSSGCPYYFWTRETLAVSWPVILSGLAAGSAFAKLPKGRWVALLPTPLGICGVLLGIVALEPTPGF